MAGESKAIEHIVLFKVKEGVPQEEIEAWLSALNALNSLECVEWLRAGRANKSNKYTHALYGRYTSREALAQYAAHPRHVAAVQGFQVVEDLLAVDWEGPDLIEENRPRFESCEALRIALLKPRQDLDKAEIVEILNAYKETFPSVGQLSFGENISPGRAKGFGWGFLCLFKAAKDLQELSFDLQHITFHDEKVMPKMEDIVVLDCSILTPQKCLENCSQSAGQRFKK